MAKRKMKMQNAKGKMQNTGKILERNPPRVRDARGGKGHLLMQNILIEIF